MGTLQLISCRLYNSYSGEDPKRMPENSYVHGYSSRESERLADQAETLTSLLHNDTRYPDGSHVLEAGCGIGAQTVILARNNPGALITSVDISAESLQRAEENIRQEGITNVIFRQGDIFQLPFSPGSFDHIFVCFVLEHLAEPCQALEQLRPLLKDGGSLTVIEGDHGSAFFHPKDEDAHLAVECLVKLQQQMGGNALIGRELFPLVSSAGYHDVQVSPRMVYVDDSRPVLVEGFTKLTFAAMVEGVGPEVVKQGLMSAEAWDRGIAGLYRTAEADGVFCYTFFKATAKK
jgi:SAM-dependent methyltransferase